jgi:Homing endonuclease associated repeat
MNRRNTSKVEVIAAILACAEKLGRVPSIPELVKLERLDRTEIRKHFGNYKYALEACNLEIPERGRKLEMGRLFEDWAGVVRKLKKLPSVFEYEQNSRYTEKPLSSRFGTWAQVPGALKMYAAQQGLAEEWRDVMELVEEQEKRAELERRSARGFLGARPSGRPCGGPEGGPGGATAGELSGEASLSAMVLAVTDESRPVYGVVIGTHAHVYAPTNESGVVCLFGAMAQQLGFMVLRIQTEFPDCEALMQVEEDRWERVRIEFEYESRNFLKHMHEASGCDLIVCWRHNWLECPMDVVELKGELPKLP